MIFDRFGTFSQVVSFPQLSASGNTFEQPNSLVALIGRFFLPIWLLFSPWHLKRILAPFCIQSGLFDNSVPRRSVASVLFWDTAPKVSSTAIGSALWVDFDILV